MALHHWGASSTTAASSSEAPNTSENVPPASTFRSAAARSWALLLVRIYECLPLLCARCGEPMRIVAFIQETEAIQSILRHLGAPTQAPEVLPARAPPQIQMEFDQSAGLDEWTTTGTESAATSRSANNTAMRARHGAWGAALHRRLPTPCRSPASPASRRRDARSADHDRGRAVGAAASGQEGWLFFLSLIPYRHNNRGVSLDHITKQTGLLADDHEFGEEILSIVDDNGQTLRPRERALTHTGWRQSTRCLNEILRDLVRKRAGVWTRDIVGKKKALTFSTARLEYTDSSKQNTGHSGTFYDTLRVECRGIGQWLKISVSIQSGGRVTRSVRMA